MAISGRGGLSWKLPGSRVFRLPGRVKGQGSGGGVQSFLPVPKASVEGLSLCPSLYMWSRSL